ncbi:MAG: Omp28-related outer membrane protein [Saprospiraceae bacterium]
MKKYFFNFILISSLLFNSCADWEQKTEIISSGNINTERVVLVEEFTGASCPNCPVGSAEIENITNKYPNNVVVLGLHSRFLAQPVKAEDPDLHTTDADNIEKFLGNYQGKPEASIDRKVFGGKSDIRIGKPDTWITYVEEELKKETEARLKIEHSYNETTRELNIKVIATALKDLNFPIAIHVAITESEIHTAQKNNTGVIDDYTHQHVLRKLLTSALGGDVLISSLSKSNIASKEYKFTIPIDSKLWRVDNCNIVAFISKDQNTKEVIQASEASIK